MTNEIFTLTAEELAHEENLQAPEFEELDDSQASAVCGGRLESSWSGSGSRDCSDVLQQLREGGVATNFRFDGGVGLDNGEFNELFSYQLLRNGELSGRISDWCKSERVNS